MVTQDREYKLYRKIENTHEQIKQKSELIHGMKGSDISTVILF